MHHEREFALWFRSVVSIVCADVNVLIQRLVDKLLRRNQRFPGVEGQDFQLVAQRILLGLRLLFGFHPNSTFQRNVLRVRLVALLLLQQQLVAVVTTPCLLYTSPSPRDGV